MRYGAKNTNRPNKSNATVSKKNRHMAFSCRQKPFFVRQLANSNTIILIAQIFYNFSAIQRIIIIAPRIGMIIEIKKNESTGISKTALASLVGVDPNSLQKWRTLYLNKGIEAILIHNKTGFRHSVFTKEEHASIEKN